MARPSKFTQKLADIICERIADGESLRLICQSDDMPARSSVFKWLAETKTFSDQYARAREAQADLLADEILTIADDSTNDTLVKERKDGDDYEVANAEWIARSRLRVDARKWLASKMAPKKYGDKVTQELTGADGGPVAFTKIERTIVRPPDSDT
jgi:hypothetical protein